MKRYSNSIEKRCKNSSNKRKIDFLLSLPCLLFLAREALMVRLTAWPFLKAGLPAVLFQHKAQHCLSPLVRFPFSTLGRSGQAHSALVQFAAATQQAGSDRLEPRSNLLFPSSCPNDAGPRESVRLPRARHGVGLCSDSATPCRTQSRKAGRPSVLSRAPASNKSQAAPSSALFRKQVFALGPQRHQNPSRRP